MKAEVWVAILNPKAKTMSWDRDHQMFSFQGQIVSIFGFADHMFSVAATQLCCSEKAGIDNT